MQMNDTDALISDLCSPLGEQSERGLKVLRNLELPKAEEVLTKAFVQRTEKERAILALNLGNLNRNFVIETLIDRLTSDSADIVRAQAAFSLGRLHDKAAVPALMNALQDSSWKVVVTACNSIKWLEVIEATPYLLELLKHNRWNVRLLVAEVLLHFNIKDVRILDTLEELAKQPEAQEHNELITDLQKLREQYGDEITVPPSVDEVIATARALISQV